MNEENSKKVEETSPSSQDKPAAAEIPREQLLDIDRINVPRERVTSVWTPEQQEEFMKSIKAKGILKPIDVMDVNGAFWLTDGLHRILAAEKLGMKQIRARIKKGSIESLIIENIIMNRQRGKSNPAQEAESLAYLVNKRGFPLETAASQMGFSPSWARKLLRVAELPEEVKDYLKHGKIPVTGAFYIVDLPTPQEQLLVAQDAAQWSYNVYQIKTKVAQLLNPDVEPEEGSFTFNAKGKPKKIPLRCRFCGAKLPEGLKGYIWVCTECEELAIGLVRDYYKALAGMEGKTPPSPPSQTPP